MVMVVRMVFVFVARVFVVATVFVMVTTPFVLAMRVTCALGFPVALPQPLPATHLPLIAERRLSTAVHPYFTSRGLSRRKRNWPQPRANL